MAQSNIRTTRLELIRTKARIKVAAKGLNLLKMKRSSLVLAFFEMVRQIKLMRGSMLESVVKAQDSLKMAELMSGRITIERIAAENTEASARASSKNIMGVKIPDLEVGSESASDPGYEVISIPTPVFDAKKDYEEVFRLLIEVAEKENALRLLLYEIEKLNRRSNAIENVAIPKLKEKASYIKQRLDDMERDQIVSIKYIKAKLEAQEAIE
ncbi:MAG: V-type ATP synthase subunit D [Candidatus Marsarchaeota archaeon]|nr:V-type ATP synthase subunit D [Candidatus Marsarchaeota archaeon]